MRPPLLCHRYDPPMTIESSSAAHGLSRRARRLQASPPLPEYLTEHMARSTLPDHFGGAVAGGYIPMCIAENKLVGELVIERLRQVREVPARVLDYDAMIGSPVFRAQLARFMARNFLKRDFGVDQIAVLAGAGSVLEILFHALADPGEGVLVPTPSYAGFWFDLETRDQLKIVPVHCRSEDGFVLTPELLDRAVAGAGCPIKALLYTSPNNPLGTVSSRAAIEEVLCWAETAGVHLVCDEIYALSVFGDRPFTSCAELRPSLGDRLHIVWAFSKDFGASGLRCGVLVSENQALLAAVNALAYWACCSGHTQYLLGELVSDQPWVDRYVQRMQDLLGRSYSRVTAALEAEGIPYVDAAAGFFLLVDLRRYLNAPTWEEEHRLWRRLLDEASVNLTPGAACHNGEPGFMRLCFASVPGDVAAAGVKRIGRVLNQ